MDSTVPASGQLCTDQRKALCWPVNSMLMASRQHDVRQWTACCLYVDSTVLANEQHVVGQWTAWCWPVDSTVLGSVNEQHAVGHSTVWSWTIKHGAGYSSPEHGVVKNRDTIQHSLYSRASIVSGHWLAPPVTIQTVRTTPGKKLNLLVSELLILLLLLPARPVHYFICLCWWSLGYWMTQCFYCSCVQVNRPKQVQIKMSCLI